jgi:excisionase family DNA binding protein
MFDPLPKPSPLLSSQEAAEILGWTQRQVQRLAADGVIPVRRRGRRMYFPREEFEAWCQGRERAEAQAAPDLLAQLLSGDIEIVVTLRRPRQC